jgi:hypothetical protein
MKKLLFSLALISFAFPFLLLTCNDKKTVEYLPLIFQDQLLEPIQGYKLITGKLDKDVNLYDAFNSVDSVGKEIDSEESEAELDEVATSDTNKQTNTLLHQAEESAKVVEAEELEKDGENKQQPNELEEDSTELTEGLYADNNAGKANGGNSSKKKSKGYPRIWQVNLLVLLLASLLGLVVQFTIKQKDKLIKISKILTVIGFICLFFFAFRVNYEEYKMNKLKHKVEESRDSLFSDIDADLEYVVGFGSGFYLCFFAYLMLAFYIFYFIRKYKITLTRLQELPNISDSELQAAEQQNDD